MNPSLTLNSDYFPSLSPQHFKQELQINFQCYLVLCDCNVRGKERERREKRLTRGGCDACKWRERHP